MNTQGREALKENRPRGPEEGEIIRHGRTSLIDMYGRRLGERAEKNDNSGKTQSA